MRRVVFVLVSLVCTYATSGVAENMVERALKAVDLSTLRALLAQKVSLELQEKERYIQLAKSIAHEVEQFSKDPEVFKNEAFYKSSLCSAYVHKEVYKLLVGGAFTTIGIAHLGVVLFELSKYARASSENEGIFNRAHWLSGYALVSGLIFSVFGIKRLQSSRPESMWPMLYSDACAAVGIVESMPVGEKPKIKE
jgi:hypothetical protein